jgi:lysophospholipase L1-like esterase
MSILLIGDSLTQLASEENGWVYQLKKWYHGKALVINKGFVGYTSKMIVDIMPKIILDIKNLKFCTILLGTNDCYNPKTGIIPLDKYKINILSIIQSIRNINPNAIIFLITPPISKINNNIIHYANTVRSICDNFKNVDLIDLYTDNAITINDLIDAVHFNANANNKLFEKIKNKINCKYKSLAPL